MRKDYGGKWVWGFQKAYDDAYDMSWEESHVCMLCSGNGCRSCAERKKKETKPPTKVVFVKEHADLPDDMRMMLDRMRDEEARRDTDARKSMSENMRKDIDYVTSLIKKDWKR